MGIAIGEFLISLREEAGASQRDTCEGICKISAYSNYELNKRVPDFLTLNLIFERLGQGTLSLSAYLAKDEIEYLQWRMDTADALRNQRYTELAGLLNQEPQECIALNEKIRKQYRLYLDGVISEVQENNFSRALGCYEEALRLTCSFLLDKEKSTARAGKLEIGIYAVYLRLLAQLYPKKAQEAGNRLEKMMDYVLERFLDEEEQVKSYPHLVCLWAQLCAGQVKPEKRLKALERAYQLLKKRYKMYHVTEVLRLILSCRKKEESHSEKKDYRAICQLYAFFDKSIEFNPYELCENTWTLAMVGDYLSRNRSKKRFTQEEISDGICAVESYSRMENSKRFPSRKNYKALSEKLDIEPIYFSEIISTGNYRAIRLRRKISQAMYHEEYEESLKLLKELEKELGPDREKNVQYFEERYALIEYELGRMSLEERYEKLKKILSYTLNIEDIGKNKHVYIRNEINLINSIAAIHHQKKEFEKGSRLLQGFLMDMEHQKISAEQRFHETYLAALNLDKQLADMGRYEEGNGLCMKWGKMAVDRGHAGLLDDYLVEISYNLDHMQKDTSDYPKQVCQLALDISDVYGIPLSQKEILAYYQSRYDT